MRRPLLRALLLLPLPLLVLPACGSGSGSEASPSSAAPSASTSVAASPSDAATPSGGASPGAQESTGTPVCADVAAPAPKDPAVSKPSGALAAGRTFTVRLDTSCGRIDIRLDQARNPVTANAFAHLVRERYYDQTVFHRVVQGFVIQGGDPLGRGTGGPDWQVVEAPPADTRYDEGVVAMAKAGTDPAGASGSQFFIVVGDGVGLPPEYAVAGRVTRGQDVADLIASLGTPGADGPPSKPVVITAATLAES